MTARSELFRALGALAEPAEERHRGIASALGIEGLPEPGDYTSLFLFGAYPYASVYLGPEGMLGGEARDRVAGFWRALGLVPPAEPDHLAALLGLYAALVDAELDARAAGDEPGVARARRSRAAFLWEHLASWLPVYLDKVSELAPSFYARWAAMLQRAVQAEAQALEPARTLPLPLHLRAAPGLPEPDAAAGDWIAALLAPVRSGVVLTRQDLRRCAAELGIGARVAERAFMLRALFAQDGAGTVGWIAAEARRAISRHAAMPEAFGPIAGFWTDRAQACAHALESQRPTGRGAAAPGDA